MKIARVFPSRTSFSPDDPDAYFDVPGLFTPEYDEVHISVTFTWDIPRAHALASAWGMKGKKVAIGGVAINGESREPFVAGRYLKQGITITTRGCPNACGFCMVNKRDFIELEDFPAGRIVQDNNILAASDRHWERVITMLRGQSKVQFKGGLDKRLLTERRVDDLRSLRIDELWLACDHKNDVETLRRAVSLLIRGGFSREKLLCYVLIGKDMVEEEARLRAVWDAGAIPFAQLYKDKDNSLKYSYPWRAFARTWSRPAAIKTIMKGGENVL